MVKLLGSVRHVNRTGVPAVSRFTKSTTGYCFDIPAQRNMSAIYVILQGNASALIFQPGALSEGTGTYTTVVLMSRHMARYRTIHRFLQYSLSNDWTQYFLLSPLQLQIGNI